MISFQTWQALIDHVTAGGKVYYQAPLDYRPIAVRVELRRGSKVRVFPPDRSADPFTADAAHLPRFKRQPADFRPLWERRKAQWVLAHWQDAMGDMSMRSAYLYVRPTSGSAWGELITVKDGDEAPAGCELACPERIPAGTKQQIAVWLERFANRLPVIPVDL